MNTHRNNPDSAEMQQADYENRRAVFTAKMEEMHGDLTFPTLKAKRLNKSKSLKDNKKGNWKYDGQASWWCDDGERHVSRVIMDCMDEDGPFGYYLYGGSDSGWVYFN